MRKLRLREVNQGDVAGRWPSWNSKTVKQTNKIIPESMLLTVSFCV